MQGQNGNAHLIRCFPAFGNLVCQKHCTDRFTYLQSSFDTMVLGNGFGLCLLGRHVEKLCKAFWCLGVLCVIP